MKNYRIWTPHEVELLKKLCEGVSGFRELRGKIKNAFPERSWHSIRFKAKECEFIGANKDAKKVEEAAVTAPIKTPDDNLGLEPDVLDVKAKQLLEILKKGPTSIVKISEDKNIDLPKEQIFILIDRLRARGYLVKEKNEKEKRLIYLEEQPILGLIPALPPITKKKKLEVLFISDLCLGLKAQQGRLLATSLAIGEQREVFFNLIAGGLIAGKPPPKKIKEYFLKTAEEQAEYVISHFPRASFNTYWLKGKKDSSFDGEKDLASIESLICESEKRNDIRYQGDEKTIIPIGRPEAKIAVVTIDTAAYTKSYPLQGVMENLQEAITYAYEHSEPLQAVIAGGLHSGLLIPRYFPPSKNRYNDFDGVALPGLHRITASQTVKRKRGGSPVLGCMVLGANFKDSGEFAGFTYAFYDLTAHFKEDDYLAEIKPDETLTQEAKDILLRLIKRPARRGELSNLIRKNIPHAEQALEELKQKGYDIWFNEARKAYELRRGLKDKFEPLDLKKLFKTTVRFAVTADWHVGNKGERPDLIQQVFKTADEKKAELILVCGNLFDGSDSYPGHGEDLLCAGADAQRKHLLEVLPKSKIPVIVISSPLKEHDRVYWTRSGHDIVDTFVEIAKSQKFKIEYLGGPQGTFKFKDLTFDMQHPSGGMPYGKTYKLQKRIEKLVSIMELTGGAKATFIGHLHQAVAMIYKGILGLLTPCLKDQFKKQDEYLAAKDLFSQLGMWIVEMSFDENKNLIKTELEYVPFEPKPENMKFLDVDELMKKWQ